MTRAGWLWVAAAAGIAVFALSFVNGWIFHDRELRGEGYRQVQVYLSAWRGVAMPVTSLAAIGSLGTAVAAALLIARRSVPTWVPVIGAALVIGLIVASAWPVTKDGHASTVRLSAWWLLPAGLAVAVAMTTGVLRALRPSRRVMLAAATLGVVAFVAGAGGRWIGLQWAEGTGRHWEVGSYTRPVADDRAALTLTLTGDRFAIGDRFGGDFESSGWTVSLDNDPACPDARGTYHAHGENEADLRFVMVVDPCLEGARAAELEAGIWIRDP